MNPSTKKLKDFLSEPIKNGYSPICVGGPTSKKVLGLGALTGSGLNLDATKWVSESNTEVDNFLIKRGDFLVSRSNTLDKVGRAALYESSPKNISCPDLMMKFRVDEKKIDPRFLELILQSYHARKHFMRHASGTSGSMVKITKSVVESLEVPLFSLGMQKSIVNLVFTWKEAIEQTERLIAAKEKQFRWLLKRLISDQQDNPKWHKVKLGQVIEDIGDGGTPSRKNSDYFGGGIPWVVIDDITFKIDKTKETLSKLGLSKSSAKIWPKDSVIVSTGATIGHVGIAKVPMATKQGITGITPQKSIISEYLAYFLLAHTHLLIKYAQGSSFKEIRPETIKKIAFFHPGINRQENIVCTLNTAQKETAFLRLLAEQCRSQKRGLMQKLLTGEWRIKR